MSNKTIYPKCNVTCDLTAICPVILVCYINGIYIRKNTEKCPCRDYEGDKKHKKHV